LAISQRSATRCAGGMGFYWSGHRILWADTDNEVAIALLYRG
jgi:hypothetical protein